MRYRVVLAAVAAAFAVSLIGAAGASAATQAGNGCVGDRSTEGFTLFGISNAPGNPMPATIPVSGVVTSWTLNATPAIPPGILSQTLKILRPGSPGQFQVVGESAPGSVSGGLNTFATRISVQSGDLIGTHGSVGAEPVTLYCETKTPGDRLGVIAGNPPVGSSATQIDGGEGYQVPITVSIEADTDNDGFGDETQDQCPQSAAFQTPCPPVTLSATKQVRKGSVVIVVTTDNAAPVTVNGVAKLGKGRKAKLKGGTKNLVPGKLGKFTLSFTKPLKAKLNEMSPKQKLTLKVTVTGTSVSGAVTKKTLKVKLKGQAKP